MYKIQRVEALTVGTTASTVAVNGRGFLIANHSANAVYFKEKAADDTDATSSNGFLVPAGTATLVPVVAEKLSVVASDAGSSVSVLILDCFG